MALEIEIPSPICIVKAKFGPAHSLYYDPSVSDYISGFVKMDKIVSFTESAFTDVNGNVSVWADKSELEKYINWLSRHEQK